MIQTSLFTVFKVEPGCHHGGADSGGHKCSTVQVQTRFLQAQFVRLEIRQENSKVTCVQHLTQIVFP